MLDFVGQYLGWILVALGVVSTALVVWAWVAGVLPKPSFTKFRAGIVTNMAILTLFSIYLSIVANTTDVLHPAAASAFATPLGFAQAAIALTLIANAGRGFSLNLPILLVMALVNFSLVLVYLGIGDATTDAKDVQVHFVGGMFGALIAPILKLGSKEQSDEDAGA